MTDWLGIALLYLLGSALLIAELFLPAHGLIGLIGLGVLGFGLFEAYQLSETAGIISMAVVAIILPTGLVVAVRNWHRTPVGRRISPPNPKLTDTDRMPRRDLEPLVGQVGRALTPLRPVGTCEFGTRRVECTAERGMIERGAMVEAIRLVDRTISVRTVQGPPPEKGPSSPGETESTNQA